MDHCIKLLKVVESTVAYDQAMISAPGSIAPIGNAPPPTPAVNVGQNLQTSFDPTQNLAGGVYKIVEKDTGRVVIELPFRPTTLSSGPTVTSDAPQINLTA